MRRPLMLAALLFAAGCEDLVFDPPAPGNAGDVYEELWRTFDRKYAPFAERGVDWDAALDRHRPASNGDDDALFVAATGLLSELDDGHVTLVAPGRPVFVAQRTFREDTHQLELDLAIPFSRMVQGPFRNGAARFGVLDDDIAYVHVAHWQAEIADLEGMLRVLRNRRGVIVDLRHNPGGDFQNGFELAARFADARRLAFTTRTKTGPGRLELGQRVEWFIEPGGPYQITTPIVVLTNGFTNSAAERTLMALATLPHVTVVGSPTAGNHGEKVGGELSNGWRYSIVPQVVEDARGRVFEGVGIPPDVRVDNTAAEIASGVDRQLDAAIEILLGGTKGEGLR